MRLLPYHEQVTGVLAVNLAVWAHRSGRVRRSQRQLLEDLLLQSSSLVDGVQVAILAVDVDHAIGVYGVAVDTPFKAVRMVGDAGDGAVGIASATFRVGALELPLDEHVLIELRDEQLRRRRGIGGIAVQWAESVNVAVRTYLAVVVV